jgi:hypothetical protein
VLLLKDIVRNLLIVGFLLISIASIPLSVLAIALELPIAFFITIIGFVASIMYVWMSGDGLFLASLRLISVSLIFCVLMAHPEAAFVFLNTFTIMFIFALLGFGYALIKEMGYALNSIDWDRRGFPYV